MSRQWWDDDKIKDQVQPLTDTILAGLVAYGLKSMKWAHRDSRSAEWTYVSLKCLWHTNDFWRPDDPRWEEVVDLAIRRRIEAANPKSILPNSDLWSELFRAHADVLSESCPPDLSGPRSEEEALRPFAGTNSGERDRQRPKSDLVGKALASFEKRAKSDELPWKSGIVRSDSSRND